MPAADLVVRGRLVTPTGLVNGTIIVRDGRIEDIRSITASVDANSEIRFEDCFVLPGIIDSHTHFRDPGYTQKEDFYHGTKAAALGGVTTVVDMPNTLPWIDSHSRLLQKIDHLKGSSNVDFGLSGGVTRTNATELISQSKAGALTLEAFTADVPDDYLLENDYTIFTSLTESSASHVPMGFYCENQNFWSRLSKSFREQGRNDIAAFNEAKPQISEQSMVSRILSLNLKAGANLVLRQMSTSLSMKIIAIHKPLQRFYCETTPHHLLLTEEDASKNDRIMKIAPPLRSKSDVAAVWEGIRNGLIDIISSDHSPHTLEEKKSSESIWDCPGGFPGVETSLPLMLDQVSKGRLSIEDIARLMSSNQAKMLGLFPLKGAILPGSMADLVVVKFGEDLKINAERLHSKCKWTPFEGRAVAASVVSTILKGKIISKDGFLLSERQGDFISRDHPI